MLLLMLACNGDCETPWYADADGDGAPGDVVVVLACEAPPSFFPQPTDCDDLDPEVGADGVAWTVDADGDGYGDAEGTPVMACEAPANHGLPLDCDDGDAELSPETWWYADLDGDGHGNPEVAFQMCEGPSGFVQDESDCEDGDAAVNPLATEVCNGWDDDCDGLVDQDDESLDPESRSPFWTDADDDGYGDPDSVPTPMCADAPFFADNDDDCDDTEPAANPGLDEICNDGIDNDCDGTANGCSVDGLSAPDWWLQGPDSAWAGDSLAAGDVDGDGLDDLLVGQPRASWDGLSTLEGSATLVHGASDAGGEASLSLSGLRFDGVDIGDKLGESVAMVDLDGDGALDLAVGAPAVDDDVLVDTGTVYLLFSADSGDWEDAQSVAARQGARLWGEEEDDGAGSGLASVGDVDGDGVDDLVVGGLDHDSARGKAWLVYGGALAGDVDLGDSPSWTGNARGDRLGGQANAAGGDLDGDGLADVVLAAPDENEQKGRVYLLYGDESRRSGSMKVENADQKIIGTSLYDDDVVFGSALAAGDLDGDGYDELIVGAYAWDSSASVESGGVFVFRGSATGPEGGSTDDADLQIQGDGDGDLFGRSLAVVPDMDEDGLPELAVGATGWDEPASSAGACFVFPSSELSSDGTLDGSNVAGWVEGAEGADLLGVSAVGGDFNGDATGDVAFGALGADDTNGGVGVLFGKGL